MEILPRVRKTLDFFGMTLLSCFRLCIKFMNFMDPDFIIKYLPSSVGMAIFMCQSMRTL